MVGLAQKRLRCFTRIPRRLFAIHPMANPRAKATTIQITICEPTYSTLSLQSNELDATILLPTFFGRVVCDRAGITVADRQETLGIFPLAHEVVQDGLRAPTRELEISVHAPL